MNSPIRRRKQTCSDWQLMHCLEGQCHINRSNILVCLLPDVRRLHKLRGYARPRKRELIKRLFEMRRRLLTYLIAKPLRNRKGLEVNKQEILRRYPRLINSMIRLSDATMDDNSAADVILRCKDRKSVVAAQLVAEAWDKRKHSVDIGCYEEQTPTFQAL